jgi:hypothetical protein
MVLPSFVTIGTNPLTSSELAFVNQYFIIDKNYRYANRLVELVRRNLFETDEFKSGVKPSIRRTGAELNRLFSFEKICGRIVAKNGSFEMN